MQLKETNNKTSIYHSLCTSVLFETKSLFFVFLTSNNKTRTLMGFLENATEFVLSNVLNSVDVTFKKKHAYFSVKFNMELYKCRYSKKYCVQEIAD